MTINYGKRNPGGLTAASPGDTIYIPLTFYNDSGASISIGATLAKTDIEVFKDGSVTERATDSGYAILGDTGNFDSRIGFKGISVSLFNTADDANFYAVGSMYWVAIDSVTVDGRTVRFFPAVFEIGETRANVVQIDGDTGAADVLQKFADSAGALNPAGELDTGSVANSSYLPSNVTHWLGTAAVAPTVAGVPKVEVATFADTGVNGRLTTLQNSATALQAGVSVTAFSDTGVNNRLAVILSDTDTGIQSGVNVTAFADTGVNSRLSALQTGVNVSRINADTGAASNLSQALATTPTYWPQMNVVQIDSDTGAADRLGKFSGLQLKIDGTLDTGTGQVTNTLNVTATATTDTGQISNAVWNSIRTAHGDTGSFGELLRDPATAVMDTGAVVNAVWNAARSDHIVAGSFGESDTGINNRLAVILADTDTGIQGGVNVASFADTGVNSRLAALQTGVNVTSFADTGVNNRLAVILADTDTGIQSGVTVTAISDTGINSRFSQVTVSAFSDTGVNERLGVIETAAAAAATAVDLATVDTVVDAIKAKTDSLTFTVAGIADTNIQYVNDVAITGIGDTGTGNTWRPA